MNTEHGVWELVTNGGRRHVLNLDDGLALSLDGAIPAQSSGWRPIVRREPIVVGAPASVWVADETPLDPREVRTWRLLPDRVILDDRSVVVSNGVIRRVHGEPLCAHRDSCWIHRPSAHHLLGWPIHWRDDNGTAERLCPHVIGHPDPDDIAFRRGIGQRHPDVHGCDGCCAPAARPSRKGWEDGSGRGNEPSRRFALGASPTIADSISE